MISDMSKMPELQSRHLSPNVFYQNQTDYEACNYITNTTGTTCRAGSAYQSEAPAITFSFTWFRVALSLVSNAVFCVLLLFT